MANQVAAYYEVLGLTEGASPAEVKRAYFKLVRKYTPEKDPDAFQKIRQAYEALKDGPQQQADAPELKPPEGALVNLTLNSGISMLRARDYDGAARVFERVLEMFPDDPFTLYHLAQAQLSGGKSQKAAKTAEALIRQRPDFLDGYSQLANALYNRGWYKKALPAFQKAYDMGDRDPYFLSDFAECAADNRQGLLAASLCWEVLGAGKWDTDNIDLAFNDFVTIANHGDFSDPEVRERFFTEYPAFIRKHRRIIEDWEEALAPAMAISFDRPALLRNNPFYRRLDDTLTAVGAYGGEAARELTLIAHAISLNHALEQEPRSLQREWRDFTCLPVEVYDREDPELGRFALLDAKLCAIKNREAMVKELPIIRSDYPYLYAWYRDFFDDLADGVSDEQFKKLKWEFGKLKKKYQGDRYSKLYPEEAPKPEKVLFESDDFTPYVRTAAKVGKNDPCPCGSGKKFKKCCMGNGKYD